LFEEIFKNFNVSENPEITLEANPDDLSTEYLKNLRKTPVNRLSIGIQSFIDDDLKMMNRRHSAEESLFAVKEAQNVGFENISGDLIYGLPEMTTKKWEYNLQEFFKLKIPHLSAYHLTYEPNTVFFKYLKTNRIHEIPETESLKQFELLKQLVNAHNFIQYETSNFAKDGFFSKHNTGYWQQKHYLGIGASAHSYDGKSRQFNIKNLKEYIIRVGETGAYFEKEILSDVDRYNDYIITTLRTVWGTDVSYVSEKIGKTFAEFLINKSKPHIHKGNLVFKDNVLYLSEKGKFIEDFILENLFYL